MEAGPWGGGGLQSSKGGGEAEDEEQEVWGGGEGGVEEDEVLEGVECVGVIPGFVRAAISAIVQCSDGGLGGGGV